jgi:hypothetical protein
MEQIDYTSPEIAIYVPSSSMTIMTFPPLVIKVSREHLRRSPRITTGRLYVRM